MTDAEYSICRTQRELYEEVWKLGYNTGVFSGLFLTSDFCERSMDAVYSHYQLAIPEEILDFCGIDMSKVPKTDMDVSLHCAGWCGFFYRMLVFETGKKSREIVEKIPFHMLAGSYAGLHTIDEEMAVDILKQHLN